MASLQRGVPLAEFAEAMRRADSGFAARVERFESRFGAAGPQRLAVLAQAAYFCWGNCASRQDLPRVCRAIAGGRPTLFHYHRQITPERWDQVHAYLVGVQRWLGEEQSPPQSLEGPRVAQVQVWLGEPGPARRALAELLRRRLVGELLGLELTVMGEPLAGACYHDYRGWYCLDGLSGDLLPEPGFTASRARLVREAMAEAPEEAERLLAWLTRQTTPPCSHRYCRYLEIQLTSIGALRWRGSLPPDCAPVAEWSAALRASQAALRGWADGRPADTDLAHTLHAALGAPTPETQAVVQDFLLAEDRGAVESWHWLLARR